MNKLIKKFQFWINEASKYDLIDDWNDYKYKPEDNFNYPREKEEEDEEKVDNNPLSELCYYVRKLFTVNGIDATVEHDEGDIKAYIFLEKREKLSSLLRCFEVVEKLQKDILINYESEVELYENKKNEPIMAFTFNWQSLSDDEESDVGEGGQIEMEDDDKVPF